MTDQKSRRKWENIGWFSQAADDHAEAQAQATTPEKVRQQREADRQALMPDPVEPENQAWISDAVEEKQLDAVRREYESDIDPADPDQIAARHEDAFYREHEPDPETYAHEARDEDPRGSWDQYRDDLQADMNTKLNEQYEGVSPDADADSYSSTDSVSDTGGNDSAAGDGDSKDNAADHASGWFGHGHDHDQDGCMDY